MTSFIQKKLTFATGLPEILKTQRLNNKLTTEELSLKSGVSVKYLEALEKGSYHLLPGEIYLQQFLKNLAQFFKLNEKALLEIYHKERATQPALLNLSSATTKVNHFKGHWLSPVLIKRTALIAILLAVISYLGWEVKNIFTPPELAIASPLSQSITVESIIEITGQTEPESQVQINQQPIFLEPDGSFKQKVNLTIGLNVFTIASSKAHSKARTETISILRQANETAEVNLKNSRNLN